MSPVFRHGRLRLYLLKLLDEAPRHGYEVIRLLQDRFMGVYAPSPGTIYPRLARLEEEGLVTHDEADGRKVYRITDKGREELRARLDDLAELEDEITASVRDIAREVTEDVRETVRTLREELTWAAREFHQAHQPPRGADPGGDARHASTDEARARAGAASARQAARAWEKAAQDDAPKDREDVPKDGEDVRGDREDVPEDGEDVRGNREDVPGGERDAQEDDASRGRGQPGTGARRDREDAWRDREDAWRDWHERWHDQGGGHGHGHGGRGRGGKEWGEWAGWSGWGGWPGAAGHHGWGDPDAYRDLERLAKQFSRELRSAAWHAQAVSEDAMRDLRGILEEAIDRIKSEVFKGQAAPHQPSDPEDGPPPAG